MKPNPDGQILPDSEFGQALTRLAREADTIVEIGTWNGGGSTLCLANGLERPLQRLITIESDKCMYETAKARYDDPRITFLNGTVITALGEIPDRIDMLLIDGGEDSGESDLHALINRCSVIALDDTREKKNSTSRLFLMNEGWLLIDDNQTDRNGWSIFRRVDSELDNSRLLK